MNRRLFYWKLRSTELRLGERTLIMGVLNVTPDSFSDGGRFLDPDRAFARAIELEEQGADIIDIGAESTKPGAHRISADEEWQRLVPVLKRLRGRLSVPLSIDTYKKETAERALEYGVEIINDPSGLTFDPDLAKAAVNGNAGLILNHMRGTPETWGGLAPLPDVMGTVTADLDATAGRARRAGVERERIVLDPGLGFGKRREQNSEVLAQLSRLAELGYPILAGPSRKSFLGEPETPEAMLCATASAVTAAILNGAHIVRVHDVAEMKFAIRVADDIARGVHQPAEKEERRNDKPRRPSGPPAWMRDEKPLPVRPSIKPAAAAPPAPPVPPPAPSAEAPEPQPAAPAPAAEGGGWAPPRRAPGGKPSFEKRPPRSEGDRPPRKFDDRPPRKFGDRPPRKFEDRPPRKFEDRPPRKFGGARRDDDKPRSFEDRPPRKFGDRPPRKFGDRPPRKFEDRPPRRDGDKPRSFEDRPPRKFSGPRREGDRPKSDRPRSDRPPSDRPPSDRPRFGGPKFSGPKRPGFGPKGSGPKGGGPKGPGGKGPGGKRPFRKRP
jgi:dihydropteroate synthase